MLSDSELHAALDMLAQVVGHRMADRITGNRSNNPRIMLTIVTAEARNARKQLSAIEQLRKHLGLHR